LRALGGQIIAVVVADAFEASVTVVMRDRPALMTLKEDGMSEHTATLRLSQIDEDLKRLNDELHDATQDIIRFAAYLGEKPMTQKESEVLEDKRHTLRKLGWNIAALADEALEELKAINQMKALSINY
jgi:hypothetical protein